MNYKVIRSLGHGADTVWLQQLMDSLTVRLRTRTLNIDKKFQR